MRHSPKPTDHRRLLGAVIGAFIAFACLVAAKSWGDSDDAALRLQMLSVYSKVNK